MKYLITSIIILLLNALLTLSSELARGFNDDIDWLSLEEGKKIAEETEKPMMILLHKSWCGACKALKPKFTTDMKLQEFSKKFVMVNIMDDEEPKERVYTPDGGYIPRILFANHKGEIQSSIKNEGGNPQYHYFYSDTEQVLKSMKKALEKASHDGGEL